MKIKETIKKHKVVIAMVAIGIGGVILGTRINSKSSISSTVELVENFTKSVEPKIINVDMEAAIEYIRNVSTDMEYAVFKESELFSIVEF